MPERSAAAWRCDNHGMSAGPWAVPERMRQQAHLAVWSAVAEADADERDLDVGTHDEQVLHGDHENALLDRREADTGYVLRLMAVHHRCWLPAQLRKSRFAALQRGKHLVSCTRSLRVEAWQVKGWLQAVYRVALESTGSTTYRL